MLCILWHSQVRNSGLEEFYCRNELLNYFRCSQSSPFLLKGPFGGHPHNGGGECRPILKVPIGTCGNCPCQDISNPTTPLQPSLHIDNKFLLPKDNIPFPLYEKSKILKTKAMFKLIDLALITMRLNLLNDGGYFDIKCLFYHQQFLFVWGYDGLEPFELLKKVGVLAQVIYPICIEDDDALRRQVLD